MVSIFSHSRLRSGQHGALALPLVKALVCRTHLLARRICICTLHQPQRRLLLFISHELFLTRQLITNKTLVWMFKFPDSPVLTPRFPALLRLLRTPNSRLPTLSSGRSRAVYLNTVIVIVWTLSGPGSSCHFASFNP